jgi:hypothetical protein
MSHRLHVMCPFHSHTITSTSHASLYWTQSICEPGLRHNKRRRKYGKGGGGDKTPYALLLPFLPRTSTGWPPTCVLVPVNEARRYLAISYTSLIPVEAHARSSATRTLGTMFVHVTVGTLRSFDPPLIVVPLNKPLKQSSILGAAQEQRRNNGVPCKGCKVM